MHDSARVWLCNEAPRVQSSNNHPEKRQANLLKTYISYTLSPAAIFSSTSILCLSRSACSTSSLFSLSNSSLIPASTRRLAWASLRRRRFCSFASCRRVDGGICVCRRSRKALWWKMVVYGGYCVLLGIGWMDSKTSYGFVMNLAPSVHSRTAQPPSENAGRQAG